MHTNFGLNFLKILIHTPFKDGCSCPINLVTRPGQQCLPRREMGIRWDFFVRRRYKMKLHRVKERRKFNFHFYLIILHNIFFSASSCVEEVGMCPARVKYFHLPRAYFGSVWRILRKITEYPEVNIFLWFRHHPVWHYINFTGRNNSSVTLRSGGLSIFFQCYKKVVFPWNLKCRQTLRSLCLQRWTLVARTCYF